MENSLLEAARSLSDEERDALIDKAAAQAGICPSDEAVADEAAFLVQARLHQLNYSLLTGALSLGATTVDREAIEREAREEARRQLAAEELLEQVITAEGLTVTPDELLEEGRAIAQREGVSLGTVRMYLGEDLGSLEHDLLVRKAMDLVCERMLQGA